MGRIQIVAPTMPRCLGSVPDVMTTLVLHFVVAVSEEFPWPTSSSGQDDHYLEVKGQ